MIPYTDYECRLVLDELYRGDKIVIPSSYEHAEFMLQVAQKYIDDRQQDVISVLTTGKQNGK